MPDMKRVGLLLVALVMTGCSGGGSTIPYASTTASSATPSLSKSVSPSEDPLYLEAVGVYKKLMAEERKLLLTGGSDILPASMSELLVEPAKTDLTDTYKGIKEDGVSMAADPVPAVKISPNPGANKGSSLVSLRVCEDARAVPLLSDGKVIANGALVLRTVYLDRVSGSLKVSIVEAKAGSTCAG